MCLKGGAIFGRSLERTGGEEIRIAKINLNQRNLWHYLGGVPVEAGTPMGELGGVLLPRDAAGDAAGDDLLVTDERRHEVGIFGRNCKKERERQ